METLLSFISRWRKSLEADKQFSPAAQRRLGFESSSGGPKACSLSTMPHYIPTTICWTELNQKAPLVRDLYFFLAAYLNGKGLFLIFDSEEKSLTPSLESRPTCCTKLACGLDRSFWSPITLHPGNGIVYHKGSAKTVAKIALWPFMFLEINFLTR